MIIGRTWNGISLNIHNQLNNVKAIEAIEVLLNEHFSLLLDYSKLENL